MAELITPLVKTVNPVNEAFNELNIFYKLLLDSILFLNKVLLIITFLFQMTSDCFERKPKLNLKSPST